MEEPRPYVPPERRPAAPSPSPDIGDINKKPWMAPRPGETKQQFEHRTSHSCFRCGVYIPDMTVLAAHEDQCTGPISDNEADAARWKS